MRRREAYWRTRFGSWVSDYGVQSLVRDLTDRGSPVTNMAVYRWLRGAVSPRPTSARIMVSLSNGQLPMEEIYRHRELLSDTRRDVAQREVEVRIDVNVDAALLLRRLDKGHKRLSFAVVNAINNTAKTVQAVEREHVRERFTLRKEAFIMRRAAKIDFASVRQAKPFAEIFVDSKVSGSPLLLPIFEKGGERKPVQGKRVAVPVPGGPARPTFEQPVPLAMRFTQLRLRVTPRTAEGGRGRRRHGRATSKPVRYGLLGTYQIPGVGVFQRQQGREEAELVYAFVQGQQLSPRLDFVETARAVANRRFSEELNREVADVLARQR